MVLENYQYKQNMDDGRDDNGRQVIEIALINEQMQVRQTFQLPMPSVPYTTDVLSSNLDHSEVYTTICDKVCQ